MTTSVKEEEVHPRKDGPLNHLRIFQAHITPSWQRFGDGSREVSLTTHDAAAHLEMRICESGEKSTRYAYATLGRAGARALRDMLNKLNLD